MNEHEKNLIRHLTDNDRKLMQLLFERKLVTAEEFILQGCNPACYRPTYPKK